MGRQLAWIPVVLVALVRIGLAGPEGPRRCSLWIDLCQGEPVAYAEMLADLAEARVVYLGERHTLARHHDTQLRILEDLAARGRRLVLGLEQLEAAHQATLDRFNQGQIDFAQLAAATGWPQRWRNYQQYQPLLEAARTRNIPVVALNAPAELIRRVAREGGVDKLPAEARAGLPVELQLCDPPYEKLLGLQLMVHMAATPERLRPMIEAQIARDECMAHHLANYLRTEDGANRMAVVLCGAGHAAYGLGMPARVQRRLGEVRQRIVLLSASGDVELSSEEKAASRDVEITHEDLRRLGLPVGDYLQARSLAQDAD